MIATLPNQMEARGNGKSEVTTGELNAKLDTLTRQVSYLTAQAERAERMRQDRAELMNDLAPIAQDAFRLASEQLEEVQEYVDLNDIVRLLKRLLRNTVMLERMLDQLESVSELADTMMPLGDQAFGKAVETLQAMERKGYFAFLQGGMQIMDNVVTAFTPEDVKRLGENIVLILKVVQDMTQPEIMNFLHTTWLAGEKEVLQQPVDISYPALFKQMRDPAVRRGLVLTMRMLHVVGAQANTEEPGGTRN